MQHKIVLAGVGALVLEHVFFEMVVDNLLKFSTFGEFVGLYLFPHKRFEHVFQNLVDNAAQLRYFDVFFQTVGIFDIEHILIVVAQRAIAVGVHRRGGETAAFFCVGLQLFYHRLGLGFG